MRSGGVQTRPGTQHLGRVKPSILRVAGGSTVSLFQIKRQLIPFTFSQTVTFMLEFSNLAMRVYKNGAQVTETAINITGISQAATCVVTAANSYSDGDEVVLSGIVGMT